RKPGDMDRLDQPVLDLERECRFERMAPFGIVTELATESVRRRSRRYGIERKKVDAGRFLHQLGPAAPRPRRRQVDFSAAIADFGSAADGGGGVTDQCFGEAHHRRVVDIGDVYL